MSNFLLKLKHLPFYISYPLIFVSSLLLIVNLLSIFSIEEFQLARNYINSGTGVFFGIAAGAFIVYYTAENSKKAFACSFAVIVFDSVLFSLTEIHISLLASVLMALLFSKIFEKTDLLYGFLASLLISLVLSLVIGILYEYLFDFLKAFSGAVKGRGALFGAVNNFYSIAFSNNLGELFFHKEYSGTALINGKIVSGVMDIFNANNAAGHAVSKYLSGKYFVNIFLSLGVFITLFSRLEGSVKNAFVMLVILAVFFGDVRLLSLFILIYNPFLYLIYLALISASYLISSLLDIRIAYLQSGSVIELFRYGGNNLYFFLSGVVFIALTYFAGNIVLSKFDFQSRKIVPREVKKIFNALGGEDNIERITGAKLFVKNPNLIDILSIDCDIRENLVSLNYDDLELIKKFY